MEFSSKFADKVVRLRHGKLDRIELLDQSTMKHNLGSQDKISDRDLSQSTSQSSIAKPSEVGKNFKSRNFKNQNAMSTNCEAGRYIDFSADYDMDRDIRFIAYCCSTCQSINFNADRDLNLNICHDINSSADYDINLVKSHGMNPSMDYYDIRLRADLDINSDRYRAVNFKISNANLKTNLAVLKQI